MLATHPAHFILLHKRDMAIKLQYYKKVNYIIKRSFEVNQRIPEKNMST